MSSADLPAQASQVLEPRRGTCGLSTEMSAYRGAVHLSQSVHIQRLSALPKDHDCEAAAERLRQTVEAMEPGDMRATVRKQDGNVHVHIDAPWGHGDVAADGGVFRVDELSPSAVALLHALSTMCDFVLATDVPSAPLAIVRPEQIDNLEGLRLSGPPVICETPADLGRHLAEVSG